MRHLIAAALLGTAPIATAPLAAQVSAPAPATSSVKVIHAGALLSVPGEAVRGPSSIVIRDGRIVEIRDGYIDPPVGAEVIDLKDRFVLPGLIDMHVHLWGIGGDPLRDRLTALNRDDADDLILAIGNARATLEAGFTTVRDLGGDARGMRALREAVARGEIAGPTIVNAGNAISVSGGHADGSNGVAEIVADAIHAHQINTCDGPDDCTRAVRQQVALGAQVIKYMSTGGVLSNVSGGLGRAMTDAEMRAIVDTAHGLGRRVATHSHAAAGTSAAVAAGVDTVDHGSFLDDETIRMMKAKGIWLVPTMMATVAAVDQARRACCPPPCCPRRRRPPPPPLPATARRLPPGSKSPSAPTAACRAMATMPRNSC